MTARALALLLLALALTGCGGGGYEGYKWRPYTLRGVDYVPMSPREAVGFEEEGIASHYREGWFLFPGKTAIGEKMYGWTTGGAHKTLPLPCRVRVTNLENGRSVVIRLNDRGPYIGDRILDVTAPVAKRLGFYHQGLARVHIKVLSVGDGRHRIR